MRTCRPVERAICAALLLCVSGCNVFLPKRTVPDEGKLPARFGVAETQPARSHGSEEWWRDFGSGELDGLVAAAMKDNLTLRQLWARLDQAGSVAVQEAALLYPQLDFDGDVGYTRTVRSVESDTPSLRSRVRDAVVSSATSAITSAADQAIGNATGTSTSTGTRRGLSVGSVVNTQDESAPTRLVTETKQFGLSLAASYEVDVWGRIASQYNAAEFDVAATRDDLESAAMTLAAEVADRWLRIHEQRELQRILAEQLKTNRTYLELVELRFRKGIVSALDVYQQRQAVSDVEQLVPLAQAEEQVLQHDLAVLLGRPPAAALAVGAYDLSSVPDPPATGIPADLLARRPDVRAAWARLYAADYRVAAARADRLPAIRLTGGIGYSADDIANVFDDWFLNLAGGMTQPLFDGFRRQAEVERTLAVVEERLADYRLVVLSAIREVEDALVQERLQRKRIEALSEEARYAAAALREASRRYKRGLSDYLPVLDALERTQELTRVLVAARRELLVFRINLYRALGGTWMEGLERPERLSDQVAIAEEGES
jgi:multidrug efflux system outer membrane protein